MPDEDTSIQQALRWAESVTGPFEILADHTREHPGQRAGLILLRAGEGCRCLKIHRDASHWASEAHAYEQWAPAFGSHAPRLFAVRDEPPLAVLIEALPGKILDESPLPPGQERAVWRAAGQALAAFHAQAAGEFFGPCARDGSPLGLAPGQRAITGAEEYVQADFEQWLERARRGGFLTEREKAIVRAARELVSAFAGERPTPCHRDYGPANWLVSEAGEWVGVIDFEFAHWDARAADFARYPNWEWIGRPDLLAAFFEGYGRAFTPREEQQILAARALYALGAIVWGRENGWNIFAEEGRQALRVLGEKM